MLCPTATSLSTCPSYSPQTTEFLQPVSTSSPEKEKGQPLSQPSPPLYRSSVIPSRVKDEQLA